MALASTSLFASFDINSNTNILDISNVLGEALILDFEFMERGINVDLDDPVEDTTWFWNDEALNADVVTVAASQTSAATAFSVSSGHGARVHIGDLLKDKAAGKDEVMQVTDISSDALTVTRGYASTTAATIAASATLAVMPAFQEGSDFGSDGSPKPVAESNVTQIVFAKDLGITRSQRMRRMATNAMTVERQLANRAKELKRYWTTISLYSEPSTSAGSDSVYRTTRGIKSFIEQDGVTNSASAALVLSVLDAVNTSVVDLGRYPDLLVVGTDTIDSINSIDASNRRLVESDRRVGYNVEEILLGQGNVVEVLVDGRVHTGDAFLYGKDQAHWRPLAGSAMFVIAATDFTDGVKRRVGSEAGVEFRQSQASAYLSNKS